MINNIKELPLKVKLVALNGFLLILGRGIGPDIFLSIYIESIIKNIRIVGILGAVLALAKLSLSIPTAYLNNKTNPKYILIFGQILYIISGIFYFLAGLYISPILLVSAILINGIASPIVFTTYINIIRQETNSDQSTSAFSLYHSSFQGGYILGAIIISFFIDSLDIKYTFLFVSLFAFISMITDNSFYVSQESGIIKTIQTHILHKNIYKQVRVSLRNYNITLHITLFLQFLYGVVDYIGYLFVPLLALSNNLSLSQIAIIFAVTRIPHLFSIYFTSILKNLNQFILVCITYILIGIILIGLSFTYDFYSILLLALFISAGLAILRPTILGFMSKLVDSNHKMEITGVQETVTRIGEIVGSIGFAIAANYSSIQQGFMIIGIFFILISIGTLMQQKLFVLPKRGISMAIRDTVYHLTENFFYHMTHHEE